MAREHAVQHHQRLRSHVQCVVNGHVGDQASVTEPLSVPVDCGNTPGIAVLAWIAVAGVPSSCDRPAFLDVDRHDRTVGKLQVSDEARRRRSGR